MQIVGRTLRKRLRANHRCNPKALGMRVFATSGIEAGDLLNYIT
jgi:hypothetical protein